MEFIRLSTWQNKLAPFLCLIYSFFYKNPNIGFQIKVKTLFILLLGIIIIAIWASLVNNYYDIEFDIKVGKPNGMAKLRPTTRKLTLALSIVFGLIYSYFLLNHNLTIILYGLSFICFYLYSSNAIRLKEKPFLDLLADGLDSQLFPSLFIFAFLFNANFSNNYIFVFSGALWLFFSMGIRALIMHQYLDEEKDKVVSLNTYVVGSDPALKNKIESSLLILEIFSFIIFAFSINWITFFIPILIYGVFIFTIKKKLFSLKFVYFRCNSTSNYRIFMYDAYTLFTFCTLALLCLQNTINCVFIVFHLLMFHTLFIVKTWNFLAKSK
ncbi:UbiA family prenyltransferase [Pedobacter sp. SD-b]|uniref:UbiA family prenyltransferase n=1 Tax=Pedobacter segetis TaxID=2793069 RepID=A0ABS1BG13_9SPHI|nr:UbiA family prenyltransferase [Pedobacter segetis]MBK0381797.1 UbiA family prenyltransferase [Pedobacter segetis]